MTHISPSQHGAQADYDPWQLAEHLLGRPPLALQPVGESGWNNHLFKVKTEEGLLALKRYPVNDLRGRMAREAAALWFLAAHPPSPSPRLLSMDPTANGMLLTWVEGEPISQSSADIATIDAMLACMAQLHQLRHSSTATNLVAASDAVFNVEGARRQIRQRMRRLDDARQQHPRLDDFLRRLQSLADELLPRAQEQWSCEDPLPSALRTLSFSDFGFHNAIRQPDGRIVFVDLEYFGWDDPVKLASDTLWHPAMALRGELRRHFCEHAVKLYEESGDHNIRKRFATMHPLYGLIWCLIVLNPFIASAQQAPALVGQANAQRLEAQLAMAHRYADTLKTGCHLTYHPAIPPEQES
ncbi:aminoglycoside phosphotransferase [Magnetococcus marinus MC-1]|uniref:Aminoglycoside phosphotransferase n=1 Tax=Magnetococcus marinus (strain ATCC BAA-1437 / JCM 17883 / MC-1) TaxID=156889 RepID=A0L6I5_MAGMM|nr:aminoglycoside phosphotransferase family protein [Magnetococcus marinus]ABK43578.1 aminoglycoside phosphotransferase [Magnetococcus marinus MC-1]